MTQGDTNQADTDEVSFGVKEFLGMTIERGEGKGTARMTLDEPHLNPNNVAHGAVPFALMDTAMGAAVMSVVDEGAFCATIEMHTRFVRAVASGSLTAEATVIHAGSRIMHLEATTHDDAGRLVASATSSFAVIRPGG